MSEIINSKNPLYEYLFDLYEGIRSREGFEQYRVFLENATSWQVNNAIDELLTHSNDFGRIENSVARFIRACGKGLDKQPPLSLPEDHFLSILLKENRALQTHKTRLPRLFKEFSASLTPDGPDESCRVNLLEELKILTDLSAHYQKLEYPLSSALEDCLKEFRCTKLMWHIHEIILKGLKYLLLELELASESLRDWKEFNRVYGDVYLKIAAMTYREEVILFPVAYRAIPEERFHKMNQELKEYGTAFDVPFPSEFSSCGNHSGVSTTDKHPGIDLSVGTLLPNQINLMLKNLPLDITYVDEKDRVRYYSQGKERIFPRSPGIIGRDVQNCHPPDSVHMVQKIVEDFKARRRESAEFWIRMGDRFIHIRYLPLFEDDVYKGVIEVSQDIAPLRGLEGEKRLLDE
ncbi:PAS domain-containing protein [Oceanispirochaeta sp.]|jgi:DUF438 domain-containing protein|uniref:PAS domain-containing protein n=1 Tax=Oceanispirochaeta sp. TaxID=2035350 RepID=UPI002630091B|nr:PAS domain-containing protein [Oceanispirochaeta sp.]MDA3957941.1 PAS domain-containing protein [Oceanispirochaeta sp.]